MDREEVLTRLGLHIGMPKKAEEEVRVTDEVIEQPDGSFIIKDEVKAAEEGKGSENNEKVVDIAPEGDSQHKEDKSTEIAEKSTTSAKVEESGVPLDNAPDKLADPVPPDPVNEPKPEPKAPVPSDEKKEKIKNMLRAAMNAKLQGAYLYYWCSLTVVGPTANQLREEFEDHAKEELKLAKKIAERLYQVGGIPTFNPRDWHKNAACAYPPMDKFNQCGDVQIAQLIEEERCAIEHNESLISFTADDDPSTNDLMTDVNNADNDHITDLKKFQMDLQLAKGEGIDELEVQTDD